MKHKSCTIKAIALTVTIGLTICAFPLFSRADEQQPETDIESVHRFVERLYNYCLERGSDEEGLEYWSESIINNERGGYETSLGFFNSPEFISRGLSNEDFVTVCYNTFLDREPDEEGLNCWVNKLDTGSSRNSIINSFCTSEEFASYCEDIGILTRRSARDEYPEAAVILDQCGWDLRAAYDWCVYNLSYVRDQSVNDTNYTSRELAHIGFSTRGGNCYVFAACFYELASCLGYDAHQISGTVPSRRGGWTIHSWVEIDIDGITYVFDPEFEYVNPEERDGWMFHYGKTGTWVYNDYRRMN